MALLFRINVVSKTLASLCCSYSSMFWRGLSKLNLLQKISSSPAPLSRTQRNLFTNSCNVYFAKKKVDEAKIPRCPDFEQFFTKNKKTDANETQPGKTSDEKKKPSPVIQQPIFGSSEKQPFAEKKLPTAIPQRIMAGGPIRSPKINIRKSQSTPEETKPQEKPNDQSKNESKGKLTDEAKSTDKINDATVDKKWSGFSQFVIPRSFGAKNVITEGKKESEHSSQPDSVGHGKTKEKKSSESTENSSGNNKKNLIWLTAAAAGLLLSLVRHSFITDG